jgi:hypothetical protein
VSVDPILRIKSPYVYAKNNPLKYIDPDGEDDVLATSYMMDFSIVWDQFDIDPYSLTYEEYNLITTVKEQTANLRPDQVNNFDNPEFRKILLIVPQDYIYEHSETLPLLERETFGAWTAFRSFIQTAKCPACGPDTYIDLQAEGFTRTVSRNDEVGGVSDSAHLYGYGIDFVPVLVNKKTGARVDGRTIRQSNFRELTHWVRKNARDFGFRNYVDDHATPRKGWRTHLSYTPELKLIFPNQKTGELPSQESTRPLQDAPLPVQNDNRESRQDPLA